MLVPCWTDATSNHGESCNRGNISMMRSSLANLNVSTSSPSEEYLVQCLESESEKLRVIQCCHIEGRRRRSNNDSRSPLQLTSDIHHRSITSNRNSALADIQSESLEGCESVLGGKAVILHFVYEHETLNNSMCRLYFRIERPGRLCCCRYVLASDTMMLKADTSSFLRLSLAASTDGTQLCRPNL